MKSIKYIPIYETSNFDIFVLVKSEFDKANISYETLYEYRLHPETQTPESKGEAIIRVPKSQFLKANHVLISLGLKSVYKKDQFIFSFALHLNRFIDKIPVLKHFSTGGRFAMFFFLLMFIPFLVIVFPKAKTTTKNLISADWCVKEITFDGIKIQPKTIDALSEIEGLDLGSLIGCDDIRFRSNRVILPGFNTAETHGKWKFGRNNGTIVFYDLDKHSEIYAGLYEYKMGWKGVVILKSAKTKLVLAR